MAQPAITNLIDPPPRLTGDSGQDTVAVIQWLNAFYVKGVLSGALLQQQNLPPILSGLGTGDVLGPAVAADGNVALFDTATGKLIKDGGALGSAAFTASGAYDAAGAAAAAQAAAISASQPVDSDLTAIAALTTKTFGRSLLALAAGSANAKAFMNAAGTAIEFAAGVKMIASTINTADASASVSYTGVGFKPSSVLAMAIINTSAEVSFGMAEAAMQRVLADNHNDTANSWSYDTALCRLRESTANYYIGTLTSFDADGLTISWVKAGGKTGTAQLFFLCFR